MPISYCLPLLCNDFEVKAEVSKHHTEIFFRLQARDIKTTNLPQTTSILTQYLPGMCHHLCHNNLSLSFLEEAKNTEIGHLFEHIVLEYLYLLKSSSQQQNPIHQGETVWNWQKEERGIFHITIDIGLTEVEILTQAVQRGIDLLGLIIQPLVKQGDGSAPHLLAK